MAYSPFFGPFSRIVNFLQQLRRGNWRFDRTLKLKYHAFSYETKAISAAL